MRVNPSAARRLAWAALAGQVLFIASWVIGGALQPGYSHLEHGVSQLAARGTENPALAIAGMVVLGLSLAALGPALVPVLPRRRATTVAVALFVGTGALMAISAFFRLDCAEAAGAACRALWRSGNASAEHYAHLWLGIPHEVLLVLTPFAIARAIWPGPAAALATIAGTTGIAIGVVSFALYDQTGAPPGLVQRIGLLTLHLWVLIVAAGVLHATRRPDPPGPLVPLRPREFFARTWTGEGELLLRPFWLWRMLSTRFEARREATWIGERAWRFDDVSRFGHGRAQRRQTVCEFVDDDHVRLTAGDLPDGADVWFEESGFRVTPFRMRFPIGPVSVPIRCHDASYVDPDGTFVNVTEARALVTGVLLAKLIFHVRPLDAEEAEREESAVLAG